MGLTEKEKLSRILTHLRTIRDKTVDLDNSLNTLKAQINNNVVINSDPYKVTEIGNLQDEISDVTSTLRYDVIPSIKERVDN